MTTFDYWVKQYTGELPHGVSLQMFLNQNVENFGDLNPYNISGDFLMNYLPLTRLGFVNIMQKFDLFKIYSYVNQLGYIDRKENKWYMQSDTYIKDIFMGDIPAKYIPFEKEYLYPVKKDGLLTTFKKYERTYITIEDAINQNKIDRPLNTLESILNYKKPFDISRMDMSNIANIILCNNDEIRRGRSLYRKEQMQNFNYFFERDDVKEQINVEKEIIKNVLIKYEKLNNDLYDAIINYNIENIQELLDKNVLPSHDLIHMMEVKNINIFFNTKFSGKI